MKLSVVVPVYNSARYIEALESSLSSQSYKDFELIIVDDGSTDDTVSVLNFYFDSFNNSKIIKTGHKGVSHARNVGINVATGQYIMFIDSDDIITPDCFEIMVREIESNNCQLAECMVEKRNAPRISSNELVNRDTAIKLFYSKDKTRILGTVYNKIFIRERIVKLFDETICIGEDAEFLLNYIMNIDTLFRIKKILYQHTENDRGIIKASNLNEYLTAQNASIKILSIILDRYERFKILAINDVIFTTSKILQKFPSDKKIIIQNLIQQLAKSNILNSIKLQSGFYKIEGCDYFITKSLCNPHIHLGEKIIDKKQYNSLEDFLNNNKSDPSEKTQNKRNNLLKLCQEGTLSYAYDNIDSPIYSKLNTVYLTKTIDETSIKESDGLFINFLPDISKDVLHDISKILNNKYLFVHVSSSRLEDKQERECFEDGIIKTLENAKLLNERTVLIHGIYFDEVELKYISESKAWLCICPLNNSCINEPIHDIDKLLDLGIKVCIGTDSISLTGSNSVLLNCNYLLQENKSNKNSLATVLLYNNYRLLHDCCKKYNDYYCLWKSSDISMVNDFIPNNKELVCIFDDEFSVYDISDLIGEKY